MSPTTDMTESSLSGSTESESSSIASETTAGSKICNSFTNSINNQEVPMDRRQRLRSAQLNQFRIQALVDLLNNSTLEFLGITEGQSTEFMISSTLSLNDRSSTFGISIL